MYNIKWQINLVWRLIAGLGGEFFRFQEDRGEEEILLSYKNVLNSKAIEESLVNTIPYI